MRRVIKILKWLFITLLLLIILTSAFAYYLLGTDSGYRQLPKLINHFTPYELTYEHLEGHLFGSQQWQNVKLARKTEPEKGIQLQADSAIVEFRFAELFKKHVHIPVLQLTNADIHLPPPSEDKKTEEKSTIPEQLPQIDLPVQIDVDAVRLANVNIFNSNNMKTFTLEHLNSNLHGLASEVKFALDTALNMGQEDKQVNASANLTGQINLKDDYPLTLSGDGTVQLPEKPLQDVSITLTGSALKPDLQIKAKGWTSGSLSMNGDINLKEKQLAIKTVWNDVDYDGKVVVAPNGEIEVSGPFDHLHIHVDSRANGQNFPAVLLTGGADVTNTGVEDANFVLKTLGGEIKFTGDLQYGDALSWDGTLLIQQLDAKQYDQSLDAALTGEIVTSGRQTPKGLNANLVIKKLDGRWQQYPVQGNGKIIVQGKEVHVDDFFIDFAGNHVNAVGKIDAKNADLHAKIDAPALNRIVAGLQGKVAGTVDVTGQANNPDIASQLNWQNLSFTQAEKTVFASKQGTLQTSGTANALKVALTADGRGENIPAMNLSATALVTPEAIKDIDLLANTLKGQAKLTGTIGLRPDITWDINGHLQNIDPQELAPSLRANITGDLQAKGGLKDGKLQTDANLTHLSGQWQGQPLSGEAKLLVDDRNVHIDAMDVTVGQNHVQGKGALLDDKLDFTFNFDGQQLAQLYPELKGTITGRADIQGTKQSPIIKANLKGRGIAYQTNRVENAELSIDTGMQKGANFNNHIVLNGVSAGAQRWQNITLDSRGKFENHHFSLKTSGGEYNAQLEATGGFSAIDSWRGTLNTLEAQLQELRWHMRQATPVVFSPKEMRVDNLCLADQYSAFCVKLAKQKDTLIDYQIDQIDPRSIQPFLPKTVRINPQLKGNGKVTIAANGAMRGNVDLHMTPGKIVVTVENQPPISLNLQKAVLNGTFTDTQANAKLDVNFENAGQIAANATVTSLRNNPQIRGALKLNVPDIGKFKYLIPQVSELKGNVTGDMQFVGPVSRPQASGELLLNGGKVVIPEYATELNNIRLRLAAQRNDTIGIDGNIGTPKGNLTANGVLRLQPLTLNLNLDGKDMLVANSKEMKVLVTPKFLITIDPNTGIVVKGDIFIPQANISIPDTSSAVQPSEDVVIVDGNQEKDKTHYKTDASTPLRADIGVRLGDKVYFKNKDINIRLIGGINVMVRPGQEVQGKGRIEVAQGVYELYGQELDIKRGWVTFSGNIANPTLDVLATREIDDVNVGAHITGSVQKMRLDLTSDPAMPDSAILSYLLLGHAPDSGTDSTALLQTAAAIGTKGLFPDDLAEKTGLDVFDLGIGGLKAGKYLMKDLYVGMKSDFFNSITKFLARYQITSRLSVEASSSQKDGNAVDMTYQFETD